MDDLIRDGILWHSQVVANRRITNQNQTLFRTQNSQREMEIRYERLKLITLAIWDLVKSSQGLTEADLYRTVRELDIADGRADRRVDDKNRLVDCSACAKVLLSSAVVCPYCGNENEGYNPIADL